MKYKIENIDRLIDDVNEQLSGMLDFATKHEFVIYAASQFKFSKKEQRLWEARVLEPLHDEYDEYITVVHDDANGDAELCTIDGNVYNIDDEYMAA